MIIASDQLVDFIEEEDRVPHADHLQSLDDAARHRPDVRPPMTTDVRLVTDATESNSVDNNGNDRHLL